MNNTFDFIAIGDIVTDAFIKLDDAEVKECIDHHRKEISLSFGDKVPYEFVKVVKGVGNSANAAVSAARLGLRSALITDVGGDQIGKEDIGALADDHVSVDYVSIHQDLLSNYHYVLWYNSERTILVKHEKYPRQFPTLKDAPKWIYLSSLGEDSLEFHSQIIEYLKNNPDVKLAFQPGTFQMKFGIEALKEIYQRSDIFFCNVEEAQRILKTEDRDIKKLAQSIMQLGPKLVVITDGFEGAYVYNGTDTWFMGVYPHTPYEITGAGDAFASTFTVATILGKSIEEALLWAPVNAMSVTQAIGAQEGLLTQEKIQEFLAKAPTDYKPKKI